MALGVGALAAQTGGPADFETDRVAYRLSMPDPSSHLFTVTIEVDFSGEVPGTVDFQIPIWSPGRYVLVLGAPDVFDYRIRDLETVTAQQRAMRDAWLAGKTF